MSRAIDLACILGTVLVLAALAAADWWLALRCAA